MFDFVLGFFVCLVVLLFFVVSDFVFVSLCVSVSLDFFFFRFAFTICLGFCLSVRFFFIVDIAVCLFLSLLFVLGLVCLFVFFPPFFFLFLFSFLFFLTFLLSRVACGVLDPRTGNSLEPLGWERQVQDTGTPENSRP